MKSQPYENFLHANYTYHFLFNENALQSLSRLLDIPSCRDLGSSDIFYSLLMLTSLLLFLFLFPVMSEFVTGTL